MHPPLHPLQVTTKKPRALPKNSSAEIEVVIKSKACVELFRNYKELGRFSLRQDSKTVAVGIVTKLYRD